MRTMIKRIDLLMPPENKSRYSVIPHFTLKFAEALMRQGLNCRLLRADRQDPKPFLEALYNDPPDCTLSFNGLLPDDQGRFFCDTMKIPHVACLIDSPTQFLILASSPYTIITVPDRFSCEFFKGLRCENVLFMPHAIERELAPNENGTPRKYEVAMLSSGIDYEALEAQWPYQYPKSICQVMHEAVELSIFDKNISCIQAFVQIMDCHMAESRVTPGIFNYPEMIDQIESYVKGKDRVELVKAIHDAPVHLFGSSMDVWKKYLKNNSNIIYHEAVNFDIAMEIMKESQIVLNSCAWLKEGTHERILAGLACGALVITHENSYMQDTFKDNYSIAFYRQGRWEDVNQIINDVFSRSF